MTLFRPGPFRKDLLTVSTPAKEQSLTPEGISLPVDAAFAKT